VSDPIDQYNVRADELRTLRRRAAKTQDTLTAVTQQLSGPQFGVDVFLTPL